MDEELLALTPEQHAAFLRRYRQVADFLANTIESLYNPDPAAGPSLLEEAIPERQRRWIAEIRELQRERTAIEDLLVALARQRTSYD